MSDNEKWKSPSEVGIGKNESVSTASEREVHCKELARAIMEADKSQIDLWSCGSLFDQKRRHYLHARASVTERW